MATKSVETVGEVFRPGNGPRAMTRVLQLFAALSRTPKGMTLSQIARALDVPKSTLVSMLRALVADGFLVSQGPIYQLGSSAFRLAAQIMSAFSLPSLMRNHVGLLAEMTGETVGLGVADWETGRVIYIEAEQSPRMVLYAMRAGISAPLYASAAGRVILAYSPSKLVEPYLNRRSFPALTSKTQTDPAALRQQLVEIRERGYCLSSGELLADTAAMAAPVFGAYGELLGALMIGAPIERMRAHENIFLTRLIEAGQRASGEWHGG